MFVAHRINTIEELKSIPTEFGVEIDIRSNGNDLILVHDPFIPGEYLSDFLKHYNHSFLILNVKTEMIEWKVLEYIKLYNIKDYFFLDSSFPMIYKLSNRGEKNIALRISEFESIETALLMKGKIDWIWLDCFTKFPINEEQAKLLKKNDFKICIVSPELQGQSEKIEEYRNYMINNNIMPDMVCSKILNSDKWVEMFK